MAHAKLWALGIAALVVVGGIAAYMLLYEGQVVVRVMDAPGVWAHVNVQFSAVYIHEANKSADTWTQLPIAAGTIDLASLQNVSDVLASARLGPGHYTQIRFNVTSAQGVLEAGGTVDFTVPSGELKTDQQFDIVSGKTTTLTVDINLDRSIVQLGNGTWIFTPVIGDVTVTTG